MHFCFVRFIACFVLLVGLGMCPLNRLAASGDDLESPTIKVATINAERMSFARNDGYRDGREIRVARYVLEQLGYSKNAIEFVDVGSDDKFDAVLRDEARLYIGAASLTSERENLGDFSTPHLSVPYGIVIREINPGFLARVGSTLKQTAGWITHPTFWVIIIAIIIYLRSKAFIVALVEKIETRPEESFWSIFKKLIWWVECTFCNFNNDAGDYVPKGRIARRTATGLTIILVIVGFNYIHEGMKRVITQLPDTSLANFDLTDRNIGTKANTTSVDFAHEMGASVQTYASVGAALDALEKGEVDTVVYDATTLKSLTKARKPQKNATLIYVGELGVQHYGAFFKDSDPMIEKWNQFVLKNPSTFNN